ncbi:hypothetical protein ACFFV7_51075 [Nonomuraea spiralis]|uniref:Uncharacterized protein n=1 Tax=Nonomuraea spiralis TaxID=46182 RepID=A0ABV5J076_9ACTN|nr:hypothetical protein [Nonomuraea spiralis]GGS88324.1 hypothetical protein GCM10010176_035110 [Nonomuraea spiralis]
MTYVDDLYEPNDREPTEPDMDDENDDQEEPPVYPAPGSQIPDQPGYVVGTCAHRVAGSEWRAGFRTCERCPHDEEADDEDLDDSGYYDPHAT